MTVVVLIGILAVVAIPAATRALKESSSSKAAQQIAVMYQVARSRAMGRGVAVLVRYKDGRFEVREAAATGPLEPTSSCSVPVDRWENPTQYTEIESFELVGQAPYELVKVYFADNRTDSTGTYVSSQLSAGGVADVCFTPSGIMMYREGVGVAFGVAARTLTVRVVQEQLGVEQGVSRTVFILPNGVARVAARTGGA
jgi:type IV fimbrial biogenesis protein FimT